MVANGNDLARIAIALLDDGIGDTLVWVAGAMDGRREPTPESDGRLRPWRGSSNKFFTSGLEGFASPGACNEITCVDTLDAANTPGRCTMTADAAPLESPADDLARLRGSVNDLGGRTALERVVQRLSELVANNKALRKQLAERGSAEEARPGLESQSSLIVNSIPGLVATLTPAGEVELVNDQVLQYCGGTLREMRQWATNGTVHLEDLAHAVDVIGQSMISGDPYEIIERIRRFDGVYRWFQVRGLPFRGSSGRIVRWYVLLTAVDDLKRAEDALRESERESRLIVDSIPGLVVALAPDGQVEFVNRQGLEFFGQPLEELKHWGTNGAIHPEDLPRLMEDFTRAIASGHPFEWEVRGRRFDGVYRWFQSRGFPLRDASGCVVRWYNLRVDVDERKRAEEELRRAYDSFADAQRLSKT